MASRSALMAGGTIAGSRRITILIGRRSDRPARID
jgi:hypothetical protein